MCVWYVGCSNCDPRLLLNARWQGREIKVEDEVNGRSGGVPAVDDACC